MKANEGLVVVIQISFLRGLLAAYVIRSEEVVINEDSDTIRSQDNCCHYKL